MDHEKIKEYLLSQERTLLTAESTFSSWIRTALTSMAAGLAILRLIVFKTDLHKIIGHIIGVFLILWGCLLVVYASIDYKQIQNKLVDVKNYKSSQLGFMILVIPILIVSILLIWVTLP